MKQIINGKTYNTSTAYRIGTKITVHKIKGETVEIYDHLYMRRKDDRYFIHKNVFQFNKAGKMYHSWECINPVDERGVDAFSKRKYKTVYGD